MSIISRFTQSAADAIQPATADELRIQLGQAQTALADAVRTHEADDAALVDYYASTPAPDAAALAPLEGAWAQSKLAINRAEKGLAAAQARLSKAEQAEQGKRRENGARALQAALKDRAKGAAKLEEGAALIAEGRKLIDKSDKAAVASGAINPDAVAGYNYGQARTALLFDIALRHQNIGAPLPDGTASVTDMAAADNGLMQS
jgi:hypothetical protein